MIITGPMPESIILFDVNCLGVCIVIRLKLSERHGPNESRYLIMEVACQNRVRGRAIERVAPGLPGLKRQGHRKLDSMRSY
jgi:hypothetical protein